MNSQNEDQLSQKETDRLFQQFAGVIPLRFLPMAELQNLFSVSSRRVFPGGTRIIQQGTWPDDRVYILLEGIVHVGNERDMTLSNPEGFDRLSIIEEGHYFGEWEVMFDIPRVFSIRAVGRVVCYEISGDVFRKLLSESPAFAQAFGVILRDRQGIFQAFDRFRAEIFRGISIGHLEISELLNHYLALEPALHQGCRNSRVLDGSALEYAVRRLPDNVTRTFAFLLRDELPSAYNQPDLFFPRVDTLARRRSIWEMLPGKDLILLRSGLSDLMDFITCLCLYACEAQKIRKRVYNSSGIIKLRNGLKEKKLSRPQELRLLWDLGFDDKEIENLRLIWPENLLQRLYEITNHREMFSIDVRRQKADYNSRRTELWTHQVGDAVRQLLGQHPSQISRELKVHIISSNTHSVINCLNPWYQEHSQSILSWAKEAKHPALEHSWAQEGDKLYAVLREYFRELPDQEALARQKGSEAGIYTLAATPATGIQVQIIDLHKLNGRNIDSALGKPRIDEGTIIINIDYAFGEQAEHILRNLILLFGKSICSVNFLGKAGSLVGRRGDVLIPTSFIEQANDLVQDLGTDSSCDLFLTDAMGKDRIHRGPMLTVEGTLLQNRLMLNFYRRIWSVIGLEMEGAHYHRQVQESRIVGMVSPDIRQRYYYYVSDLPLDYAHNLSKSLRSDEGIPPLYASTREVLYQILTQRQ